MFESHISMVNCKISLSKVRNGYIKMSREGSLITSLVTDDQVIASSVSFEAQKIWNTNTA